MDLRTPQGVGRTIFLGIVAVMVVGLLFASFSDGFAASEPSVRFAQNQDDVVRITAWTPEQEVRVDVPFWTYFDLSNRSSLSARDLRLEPLVSDDWEVKTWEAWTGSEWTAIADGAGPQLTLDPGESRRYRLRSAVMGGPGKQTLLTAVTYTSSGREQDRTYSLVSLGPMRVGSWMRSLVSGMSGLTSGLLLPLVLGVLAWFWPWAEAKSREEKEALNARMAEQAAQSNQTWTLLLPYTLQVITKYYMPACSAIQNLLWEQTHPSEGASKRPQLYCMLRLLRHMRDCRDEIGGLHFKDRDGEQAAAQWWGAIRYVWDLTVPLGLHSRVLDHLESRESYSQFQGHFSDWRKKHDFLEMERIFNDWCQRPTASQGIEKFENYLGLFKMFRAVVHFEANRPLEHWYQRKEKFEEVKATLAELETTPHPEVAGWPELIQHSRHYVTETEKVYQS